MAIGAAVLAPRIRAAEAAPGAGSANPAPTAPRGPFTLPPLGYDYNALEPVTDARTMEIHHQRHHQAYVNNANTAVQHNPELHPRTAEQILRAFREVPGALRAAVQNNVGGHANHTLFWDILTPGGAKLPTGALDRQLRADFKTFEDFARQLSGAALSRFGSGWAWLVVYNRKLAVYSSANQDSPLMDGATPILGIDVWEHAYYLQYQNRRADYVAALMGIINWDRVARRFDEAM